ncbi:hypothetical protein SAMN02799630_03384 [Paenibacillus sp. UNCCL117]|uniref:class I SAM-dependent methyltransferase n=1 Tax=unclassified Paenibacillus TaxID=185978 RepID=UPI000883E2DC|nr:MULTISPECIES: class I SAM-dependent methyltransferase [unclassified Paenibacillus]SDE44427.1 hypothetical protein SAMN04488602_12856 [Paenibacillus sp. cl123]SFW46267.1 hypothetical protein SAMN02799630_03384 [Paenibacillus sp. UNCCL117]
MQAIHAHLIEHQLQYNGGKSLFYEDPDGRLAVEPSPVTLKYIRQGVELVGRPDGRLSEPETRKHELATYASKRVLETFVGANQYMNFNKRDADLLTAIIRAFFEQLLDAACRREAITERRLSLLFEQHYRRLQAFLIYSNGEELFRRYRENKRLFDVVCEEYRPELQLRMMKLELDELKEPVLDIGCGREGRLVKYLRAQGIQAFGMDRLAESGEFICDKNWLEMTFEAERWGTMISHMAFSNHFSHHFYRKDGNYAGYMRKFMEMLRALQVGGSFVAAPSIPFLQEAMRGQEQFRLVTGDPRATATKIRREC